MVAGASIAISGTTCIFLALGEAPDEEGLAFATKDLEHVDPDVPLVVYFHLAILGPWSQGWWFADGGYHERLATMLAGRNVAAIFHGHHHVTAHYRWKGYDVFKPGPVKDGGRELAVVHITDAQMTVATYNYAADAWSGTFSKPINVSKN
jgi:hypothetical protein